MALAAKVKHFLEDQYVAYRIVLHERANTLKKAVSTLGIQQSEVIQSVLLKDKNGVVLAILPLDCEIDLAQLFSATGREFEILSSKEADRFFDDCEPGSHPPLGKAYGLPTIVDKTIAKLKMVYFEAGCHTALIQLSMDDFQFLTEGASFYSFALLNQTYFSEALFSIDKQQESEIKVEFPELPIIAQQILAIAQHNPSDEAIVTLTNLISNDMIVNEHILQCARHYLRKGENEVAIDSIQEVITKILGFKTVSHIAVGIAAGRTLQVPEEGPLGLHTFWRHTLQNAILTKKIAEQLPSRCNIDLNLSYLAGFFHNFGYLLLGHWFPHEFRLLNRWVVLNPETPIEILEKRLLGMGQARTILGNGHARLGAWLMQDWAMPEPIITVARFHHTVDYEGAYAPYVHLIQLANQLLKATGLGDGQIDKPDLKSLETLGLTSNILRECVQEMQQEMQSLNQMAQELVN